MTVEGRPGRAGTRDHLVGAHSADPAAAEQLICRGQDAFTCRRGRRHEIVPSHRGPYHTLRCGHIDRPPCLVIQKRFAVRESSVFRQKDGHPSRRPSAGRRESIMSAAIAEPMSSPLTLSTRLIYQLGDPHSTLRATTDRCGAGVLISAGGEVDACNEHTWRQLVSEAASVVTSPGPFVVDVTGLDFMA